jgi:hypothetical protein
LVSPLEQRPWDRELARVEVADAQIADLPPARLERSNLVGDRQDAGAHEAGEAAGRHTDSDFRLTSVRMV